MKLRIENPWSYPSRYFVASEEHAGRCIAPTQYEDRPRCSFTIEKQLAEATELIKEIEALQAKNERRALSARLVLLLCCGEWHREKLRARPQCLRVLAKCYDIMIKDASLNLASHPHTPQRGSPTPFHTPSPSNKRRTPERALYELEPRDRNAIGADPFRSDDGPLFVPYKSAPADHINDHLISNVSKPEVRFGSVYAFTWPTYPGFVKIGYTEKSADARVEVWNGCHPGATLLVVKAFAYPEQIERLIHLEMKDHRRKIVLCPGCFKEHHEWFELSAKIVEEVFDKWHKIVTRSPLYDESGMFTSVWTLRKKKFSENVTSAELLGILDREEERLKKRERLKEEERQRVNAELVLAEKLTRLLVTEAEVASTDGLDDEAQRSRRDISADDEVMAAFGDFMFMLALDADENASQEL